MADQRTITTGVDVQALFDTLAEQRNEGRLAGLEEAAAFCAKLGHPHAASEIRRQLIRGEGGDHG